MRHAKFSSSAPSLRDYIIFDEEVKPDEISSFPSAISDIFTDIGPLDNSDPAQNAPRGESVPAGTCLEEPRNRQEQFPLLASCW